ncbi:MAG TPA: hypothetical protein VMT88_00005, partial [Actinomycetes bacterium]|nr:hypothetical protein [Actinomycetes bacterium]
MSTTSRSLADDLRHRDDDSLALLLIRRPDLSHPLPSDLGQLAARSVTQAATARAVDRLNAFQLQVLEVVVVVQEPATRHSIEQHLPETRPADVEAVLDDLHVRALIWGPEDGYRATAMV